MNKDQIKGAVKDAAGKVQQKIGMAVGSKQQQIKGLVKRVEGQSQKTIGDIKEAFKKR
ncbi:CsbD family protein [Undibacterium arcticum]|uniref:CsbD family protein n=1 Tax=Undibacterium arcticum TaxID=1762892 RepID=A0ABV7F6X7_9BURK